jgi:phage major head subunit gpT-like protein
MGFPSALSEWVDRRVRKDFRPYRWNIANKRYQSAIDVERQALERDQLGHIESRVRMLAMRAKQFRAKMLVDLLEAGFSTACYDGQFFFDSDHSEGDSGAQSNTASTALSEGALETGIASMEGIKDDEGEPLGLVPDLLVVGPNLRAKARKLLNATSIVATGTTDLVLPNASAVQGMLDLAVSPLISGNHWFLGCTNLPVQGLIRQPERPEEFQAVTDLNDSEIFETEVFKYGVNLVEGFGYHLWQLWRGYNAS